MEPFDRRVGPELPSAGPRHSAILPLSSGGRGSSSRSRTPKAYRVCEGATAGLITFMVVFTPWAFGTTQDWSVWTMNAAGFLLGLLLLAKWIIRHQTGYVPPRWDRESGNDETDLLSVARARRDWLTYALAALTGLVLAYSLVSALNARAIYIEGQRRFEYRDCINWLPHSYDRSSTWNAFWMYLGLACFFWAARDWLLGKSGRERRRKRESDESTPAFSAPARRAEAPGPAEVSVAHSVTGPSSGRAHLPGRLQFLLWLLCINGSVLALEAILQRLSGTNKLLWLVVPRYNDYAQSQFGPYAYRANAASYFNLLWPLCLGFWLVLRHAAKPSLRLGHRVGSGSYLVLLPGAVLMAACPIISTTRGGALIAVASILVTMGILLWSTRKESRWFRVGVCSLFAIILAVSALLGLKDLAPRFQTIFTDQMSRRTEIYKNALPIAHDFPVLGTGPGTFGTLYQLYRGSPEEEWAAYVHDDWLETRISFGWVGFSMILLMLGLVLARWFAGGGVKLPWELAAMIWVALGGCLLHGKFDFPFQVYSILLLFLLQAAILFCLSRRQRPGT